MTKPAAKTLGVISDTHGLLRPEALAALRGCDAIVHAGDVGKPEVLEQLARLAPLTAIRGNVDDWATHLPDTAVLEFAGKRFFVIHDVHDLAVEPRSAGFAAVIAGHSHAPKAEWRNGVLHLNPGSAGPRRFKLRVSVARVQVSGDGIEAELITLPVQAPRTVRRVSTMQTAKPASDGSMKKVAHKKSSKPKAAEPPASQLIDERIRELGDWRGKTLARMRALILDADPEITEEWKWSNPVWSHHGIVCTGESYKKAVKLTFARGAAVRDPKRLFNSSLEGNVRRAIDIHEGEEVDAAAFKALIKAAVAHNGQLAKKP